MKRKINRDVGDSIASRLTKRKRVNQLNNAPLGSLIYLPVEIREIIWELVDASEFPLLIKVLPDFPKERPLQTIPLVEPDIHMGAMFASKAIQIEMVLAILRVRGVQLIHEERPTQLRSLLAPYPWAYGHLRKVKMPLRCLLRTGSNRIGNTPVWAAVSTIELAMEVIDCWRAQWKSPIMCDKDGERLVMDGVVERLATSGIFSLANLKNVRGIVQSSIGLRLTLPLHDWEDRDTTTAQSLLDKIRNRFLGQQRLINIGLTVWRVELDERLEYLPADSHGGWSLTSVIEHI